VERLSCANQRDDLFAKWWNIKTVADTFTMDTVRYSYLKTVAGAEKAVLAILTKEKPIVGVKCLGVNIGQHGGFITLIAVSCWDGKIYLFDVKLCPAIVYEGGILRLLQSVELLKVFHNCGPDCATLQKQFGIKVKHFFDTQIAHAVIMEKAGMSPRRVSLQKICEIYKEPPCYTPSDELERLLIEDPNVWARRPLTKPMQKFAAAFVSPLVPEIFTKTDSALPPTTDDWFTHLCEENRLSRILKSTFRSAQSYRVTT